MKRALSNWIVAAFLGLFLMDVISCRDAEKEPESADLSKIEKRIDSLMEIAEKNPEDVAVLNTVADLAVQNKDTGLALHYLRQSLSVSPDQTNVAYLLAGILQSKNDSSWEKIADQLINSNDPTASSRGYFLLGINWANNDKFEEAIEAFDKSISLNYSFTDPYIEKAIVLLEKNKTEDALDVLYTALELDRQSPDIHFLIGESWLKKKKPGKALPFYKETLKLDPDFVSAQKRIEEIKP